MERRQLGKTDMHVAVLGLGGAEIGAADIPDENVEKLLLSALDAGLNAIDTAECYGISEERIGKFIAHRRSEFYLFTKCGHSAGFDLPDWDPRLLQQSIDRSLQRLKTPYVDLIQLHSCSEELLRQGDVIDVLQRARDAGKTRYIGYSGDSHTALYAVVCGAFDTLQTSVNIADQEVIDLVVPAAIERGIGIIAKRPLANAAWTLTGENIHEYFRPYRERLEKLDYDFLKDDPAGAVATALRFTLSVPGVCTAIVGTAKPGRWQENAALIAAGNLPPEQYAAIRARWKAVAGADWVGQT
ncbi:MAG TPA: aldo/keto reductase [Chthonomonadales bacterium]|nr:aldo/keto reductase [Chthonomonadales bacterium]